jgi:hypothetical protein
MNKVTIKTLLEDTFRRSTLIAIPNLTDLLELNESYTKWQVFYDIVRISVRNYERYYPLNLRQRMYISVDPSTRMYEFKSNFQGYIDGVVAEDQISLIPSSIAGLATVPFASSGYVFRRFAYNAPFLMDFWFPPQHYWVQMITNRPMYEEYDKVTEEPTDRCAVYYVNRDLGSEYAIFADEVYRQVCRYIIDLKKNMTLQNLPIELFSGIEEDYNKISSELESHYSNSLMAGHYII